MWHVGRCHPQPPSHAQRRWVKHITHIMWCVCKHYNNHHLTQKAHEITDTHCSFVAHVLLACNGWNSYYALCLTKSTLILNRSLWANSLNGTVEEGTWSWLLAAAAFQRTPPLQLLRNQKQTIHQQRRNNNKNKSLNQINQKITTTTYTATTNNNKQQ